MLSLCFHHAFCMLLAGCVTVFFKLLFCVLRTGADGFLCLTVPFVVPQTGAGIVTAFINAACLLFILLFLRKKSKQKSRPGKITSLSRDRSLMGLLYYCDFSIGNLPAGRQVLLLGLLLHSLTGFLLFMFPF
jgi:hypothetical protein